MEFVVYNFYFIAIIHMFVFVVCSCRIPILVKNVKDRVKGEGDRHGVRSPVLISARWVWFLLKLITIIALDGGYGYQILFQWGGLSHKLLY